jgi:hypothetical protein
VPGLRVTEPADSAAAQTPLDPKLATSRRFRIVASVLIIGHVWAIVGRPIEFATQGPFGTSPSATLFRNPVRAYSEFTYLDHGYAFFAPDPGPSHLIAATVKAKDGKTTELRYPDLRDQRPRLMYHRHFMLSEFLNNIYHPPGEPPQTIANNPIAARQWRMARRRYESVRDSITDCLRKQHPECDIVIERLEHRQPGLPEFFQENVPLDDARLVTVLLDEIEPAELPIVPPVKLPSGNLPRSSVPRSSSIEEIRPIREEAAPENSAPTSATTTEIE